MVVNVVRVAMVVTGDMAVMVAVADAAVRAGKVGMLGWRVTVAPVGLPGKARS